VQLDTVGTEKCGILRGLAARTIRHGAEETFHLIGWSKSNQKSAGELPV
jgi:hypothetical protein